MTEDEAAFVLREWIMVEQRRLQRTLAPIIAELANVEGRKPPRPYQMPDGRVMVYTGPTATDIAGPYRVPAWLEQIAIDDPDLRCKLSWYREYNRRPDQDGEAEPE